MKQNHNDNVLVKYSTGLLFHVSSKLVPLCGCCDWYGKIIVTEIKIKLLNCTSNMAEKNWKKGILTWIIFNKIWRENLLEKVEGKRNQRNTDYVEERWTEAAPKLRVLLFDCQQYNRLVTTLSTVCQIQVI